jgi:hypothetical protein
MKPYNAKPWEARAFAERRKTLIVRPEPRQPPANAHGVVCVTESTDKSRVGCWYAVDERYAQIEVERKPPFTIGQRYYVRETWGCQYADRPGVVGGRKPQQGDAIEYAADHAAAWKWRDGSLPWRSSTQMPQWAARTHFAVVAVRCKRAQEISTAEAEMWGSACHSQLTEIESFQVQFNIDHPGVWDANQWCWFIWVEVKDGH